jgi:copper ion binding protein
MKMVKIKIQGMTCEHCVRAVTRALSGVEGVTNVKVSLEKNEAVFDTSGQVDMEKIKKAIEEEGYKLVG